MARRAPAGAGPPFGPLSTLQLASLQVAASPCGPSAGSPTTHKHTGSKQPPAAHRCTRPPAPRMRAFSSGWLGLWSRVRGMARRPRGSCRAGVVGGQGRQHGAGTARQVISYWQAGCHTVTGLMLPQNQLRLSGPAEKGAWRTWRASTALLSPTHAVVSRRPCRQAVGGSSHLSRVRVCGFQQPSFHMHPFHFIGMDHSVQARAQPRTCSMHTAAVLPL